MSCPNRCSNDFKVKNFPDEIECVVANKIKANDFVFTGPSNENIANEIIDSSSNLQDASGAVSFTGPVLKADNTPAAPGTVLRLTGDNALVVAL